MSDTLEVFGKTWTGVEGFKATDNNGVVQTYSKGMDFIAHLQSLTELVSDVTFNLPNYWLKLGHITRVYLPNATGTGQYQMQFAFRGLPYVTSIVVPSIAQISEDFIRDCPELIALDLTNVNKVWQRSMRNSAKFNTLIIRASSVPALPGTDIFGSTPFASSGTGGTFYVPNSLISSYQSATNWSTILGYTNNQIKSIESTHTDPNAPIDLTLYYADGTLIPTT